jgi:hypothetical protein
MEALRVGRLQHGDFRLPHPRFSPLLPPGGLSAIPGKDQLVILFILEF